MISAPEMVVEGDGHAVFQSSGPDGCLQTGQNFVLTGGALLEGGSMFGRNTGKDAAVGNLIDMGDILQLIHAYSSSTALSASARAMSRWARITTGLSIIFPLRLATPLPRALASAIASIMA